MASSKEINLLTILAVWVILVKAGTDQVSGYEDDESSEGSGEMKPQGRYYSLSTCDYRMQPGYTCLSCSRALRCYISNTAILVDCRGLFPYCRDGHCSMYRATACENLNQNLPLSTFNTTMHGAKGNVTSSVDSDTATNMMATDNMSIVPGEGIASQHKVKSIPVDVSQNKLNRPLEDLDKYVTLALSENLVKYR